MASSSISRSWRYDVFPSFRGEDVRRSFLSHLLEKLERKLVTSFIDHGIERSRPIGPELICAIRESRISIVVFSKKYASSTWCLNELVEIHKCYEELGQMVIPIFYDVDPSHVRKQIGDFGKDFNESCKGKPEDLRQRWIRALVEVANMAGEDSQNWSTEASMIERIANDVSKKLITPSNDFGDFVGIEAHIERLGSVLSLESEGVRRVGILGPSGIGKTTIARALFSRISSRFDHHAFVSYKRTNQDDFGMKLCWEETFLSEILCEKDIKICHLGVVEQKLKNKKVLIIVDDVDDLELLTTLVGQTRWVGSGSRIIVITQDRKLLKSHDIGLIYEVDFPLENLALQMFCRSAFGQNSPPNGFMELAVEVVWLSGNLPLGLNVFGSSFRGMDKEEWMEILPGLRDGLDGKIEKTLRRSYDRLDGKDQDLFLYIACLFSGRNVDYIKSMLGDRVNIRLRMLEYKSLIRITPSMNTVQMHSLLQKLGKEIVRAESINNPGQRRFLVDADDICDVFTNNSGTENVQGILFNTSEINEPLFMDENSFKGMRNLLFLKIYKERSKETGEGGLHLPQDLVHFPRKIRSLHWNEYPLKSMPFNFRAENLVKLKMRDSKLENLWEGTQVLPSLKKMDLRWSADLKEIPDLSTATNLEKLDIRECSSLVTLPSSIGNLKKMRVLLLKGCSELKVLPADISLKSLGSLDLRGCFKLKTFPRISRNISELFLSETEIAGEDCLWIENISQLNKLDWDGVPLKRMPSNFRPEYLMELRIRGSRLEKLWPGVQLLEDLKNMDLSGCESLKQIPDLSLATGLEYLELNNCRSLVMLPSSIRNLRSLTHLSMKGCTMLEVLPTGLTLESLRKLDLSGCSQLKCFPHISARITDLYLVDTAIEEVPSWIGYMVGLTNLRMSRCKKLKKISANILKLRLLKADFSDCEGMAIMFDASVMYDQLPGPHESPLPLTAIPQVSNLKLNNCFNLDRDAREIIARSYVYSAILPGGEVPMCFTHRAHGSSLIIPLHKSSFSPEDFGIKACIVVGPPTHPGEHSANIWVRWCFRGKKGVHLLDSDRTLYMMDHLVMFFFGMCNGKVDESPSDLNDVLQFEFYHHSHVCSCNNFGVNSHTQTCALLPQRIKACGVRVFNVSPPQSSLVQDLQWHGNLKQMDLSGDENLRRIPSLSIATDLEDLELNNCQSLVILPSSIKNLRKLTHLSMKGCTMLEVLPTGLYLESLRKLDLSGCSRLKCFPHISARIEDLYLIDTAIEEVPSWIENMVRLMNLKMSQCKKLKRISANIFKLRHLEADFSDCEGMTTMFDASVMDDQLPGCLPFTINNLKLNNCFNLDRDAQEIIAQAYIYSAILPGAQVPMYFTHRASGSSLNIPLQMSSLFQEGINIKACIVVEPPIHPDDYSADIGVCWYLRGQKGFKTFLSEVDSCKMDHKVMKYFTLRWYEGDNESSTDLNDNILQFEFYYRSCGCYLDSYGFYEHTQSCALLPQRIKECGVRVVNFSPSQSPVTSVGRSETDDIYQLYGESDRCKKRMRSSRIITTWDMASFVNLKEFPDVSSFINLHCLSLNNCGNLVMVPSSIRYLNNLKQLYIVECTRLEVLPTNINLPSLLILDLSGCSRLKCFPQISMIISDLYLDDTRIEEVPSWIENMASLVNLKMRQCNKLKTISANILKLRLLKADFSDCEGLMTMSDASVMDGPHEDSFPLTVTTRVSNLELLPLGFYRILERVGLNTPPTPLKLNNCFNLDRDSREIIAQSYVYSAILPGGEVPMYFTHQARGTSLNIPLHRSLISQEEFGFKACIVVGPPIHPEDCSADIWVRWCFRGKKGELLFGSEVASCKMDHLVMVFFGMPKEEVDESPSDLNYNVLQFEFYYHSHTGSCDNFGRDHYRQICPNLPQRIKGCGVRVLNILPSQDDTARSSVTEYNQQSGESDDQTNRICEAVYNHPARESDVETGRNKKRMRMTDITSQEPSTSLNSGLMAPNLELSLELVGASAPVYSRSMGDGPSLNLNLSPFDLCLGGESSCFDPMITEQEEDTGKPNEDPSLSPFDLCLGGESSYFDPMVTEQEDTGTPNEDPSLSPQLVNYLR